MYCVQLNPICAKIYFIICYFISQNEFNIGLDLSEARASLLSGDVVELTNATSSDPTNMKLVWEVSARTNYQDTLYTIRFLNI